MNKNQIWQKYPLLKNELSKVNSFIEKQITIPFPQLEEALKQMANNGGKYLRPSLLILSAKACGLKHTSDQIIKLASSIEILHMATLIHDDIIDDSDKRRGQVSIQAHFGKDVAVYAGDFLFTKFFNLILETVSDQEYLIKNSTAMSQILNGELSQTYERFNINQHFAKYLNNISGKTAALFRLAAEEGAYYGGSNPQFTKHLANFGENLGIAFQIIDDILDYTGSKEFNKPVLEDISTGVYSLPLLIALSKPELKQKLTSILNKKQNMTLGDIQEIQTTVTNSVAIDESRQVAQKYSQNALDSLSALPTSPAKELLVKMTQRLLKRTI